MTEPATTPDRPAPRNAADAAAEGRRATPSQRAAAAVTLLEALVVLGFCGFYVYETAVGATDDVTRAVTSGVLILVFGVGLLALARGWARAADWPRTPTLLWNALLLPVAWSLRESERPLVALGVGAVAVAGVVAAIASPARADAAQADDPPVS